MEDESRGERGGDVESGFETVRRDVDVVEERDAEVVLRVKLKNRFLGLVEMVEERFGISE